jgi:hypothetical protein
MGHTEDMGDLARVEKLAMEAVISQLHRDLEAMTSERDEALEELGRLQEANAARWRRDVERLKEALAAAEG